MHISLAEQSYVLMKSINLHILRYEPITVFALSYVPYLSCAYTYSMYSYAYYMLFYPVLA
jgi:hypothetical protein